MKVRLTIDVDARDRYVIAKYFGLGTRATRMQIREFSRGAVRSAVKVNADAFTGRQRATAKRLENGTKKGGEGEAALRQPRERQLNLLDGARHGHLG